VVIGKPPIDFVARVPTDVSGFRVLIAPMTNDPQSEQAQVFADLLLRRLTSDQIASALEEWELICEQRGAAWTQMETSPLQPLSQPPLQAA
jgi:hypothetical protein